MKGEDLSHDEVAMLVGQATMQWNQVHSYFFLAFFDCSGLDLEMARAIYYSIPSDKAQRALASVAVRTLAGPDSVHSKEFARIVRSADRLAAKRNAAVHQLWDADECDRDVVRPNVSLHLHAAFASGHVKVLRGLDSDIGRIYIDLLEWNRTSFDDLTATFNARRSRNSPPE